MKRLLIAVMFVTGGSNVLMAEQQIPMQIINESDVAGGSTYAPPRPWYITEDNSILTLPALADNYMLELRDENDDVVYSVFLLSGTTSVILPSMFSGDFEIRLVGDSYYYRGYIVL